MPNTSSQQQSLQRLSDLLDRLRIECPWDKAQTLASLRYLTIEEVYELSEAVAAVSLNSDDAHLYDELKKELGDLLLHVMFYSKIAADGSHFSLSDVADSASDKLIRRHPHIFGNGEAQPWEKVKMREGRKSVLEGVPATLPPLVKAVRMQEKAEGIGYSEPSLSDRAIEQLGHAGEDIFTNEQTFGDALLRLLHQAHRHGINADDALTSANLRYQHRVEQWEQAKCQEDIDA